MPLNYGNNEGHGLQSRIAIWLPAKLRSCRVLPRTLDNVRNERAICRDRAALILPRWSWVPARA